MLGLAASPSLTSTSAASTSTFTAPLPDTSGQSLAAEQDEFIQSSEAEPAASTYSTTNSLPAEVAFAPGANPAAPSGSGVPDLATATLTIRQAQPATSSAAPAPAAQVAAAPAQDPASARQAAAQRAAAETPASAAAPTLPGAFIENRVGASHGSEAVAQQAAQPASPPQDARKQGFLSAFFAPPKANAAPAPVRAAIVAPAAAAKAGKPLIDPADKKPLIQMASVEPAQRKGGAATDNALPGVRTTALFEITRKSGLDDDSDVDLHEDEESPVRVASAAGLARLAPNGLLKQTEHVDVACLKPALLRVLGALESHYGKKAVITSGYRDPARNRRARGARNSLHMFCAAADVQIPGVSKVELASYVRSMPGRGGVGTYCHTESVHIDVGPERDWNWRCRRRK
jgi:uncharacterized protein YcbK (DUF882 family)